MVFEDELPESKRKSSFSWLLKLLFILCALFAIFITILISISGNSQALKQGLENYLSTTSGMKASIGELHKMTFFPHVVLDVSDISFAPFDQTAFPVPVASIESLYISSSFWNIFFHTGKMTAFEMNELIATKDTILPRGLRIRKMELNPTGYNGAPAFVADGKYGQDKFSVVINMNGTKKLARGISYSLGKENNTEISIGDISSFGKAMVGSRGGVRYEIEEIKYKESKASGHVKYLVYNTGSKGVEVLLESGNSQVEMDFDIGLEETSGKIFSKKLDLYDFNDKGVLPLLQSIAALSKDTEVETKQEIKLLQKPTKIRFEIGKLLKQDQELGNISFTLNGENKNNMKLESFSGKILQGKPKGKIELSLKDKIAHLKLDIVLDDFNFGLLKELFSESEEKQQDSKADINIALKGTGVSYQELVASLAGDAVLIAEEGRFDTKGINIWGGGIVNAMLPDLSDADENEVNCLIADFNIEEGLATADPLFLDTKEVTVVGEGTVDLLDRSINLLLKPESKGLSIGDAAVPVRIKGDLFNPSIGPDGVGLGLKLGSLFLGTINPAFWAYSLTDLGITESHPCHKYFLKEEDENKEDGNKPNRELNE
jgi:hypothetical protein